MGNRNLTLPLFGFLIFGALLSPRKPQVGTSSEAKLPSDLGGKMPPFFDQDVARVVDDIARIEADTLSQMEHTALDRQGQFAPWGSYYSSISIRWACSSVGRAPALQARLHLT